MRKNAKLLFAVTLILVLAVSAWARGGGQSGGGTSTTIDRSNFNPLGQYPLVKNKENITVLVPGNLDANMGENLFTPWYEEKTNIHVNWQYAPGAQFKERVNLAFASGEALDLVVGSPWSPTGFSQTEFLRLANQRLIVPVGDLIESDAVNMKANLDKVELWREALTMPDGKIYSVPNLTECLHCAYYGKMWINKEFLKNVSITKYPTTPEEFRQMLIAFRDKDANGNGDPNDEIPMMSAIDGFQSKVDTYLMSAFVYDDGLNRLYLDNGKVKASYQQNEFQEGLVYLNGLYKEDLISRDSFSATTATRNQVNSQKYESIIGAIPYAHHGNTGTREAGEPVRWIDYEPIAPLKGPHGFQVARYDPYYKFMIAEPGTMIPATSKNPALIMRFLDFFHDVKEGAGKNAEMGIKGVGWTDADPNGVGLDGKAATFKQIRREPGDPLYRKPVAWGQLWPNFRDASRWSGQQNPANIYEPDGSGVEGMLFQKTLQNYVPYGNIALVVPPLWYSIEDASEMSLLTTNINTYVEESIARFVVGDIDPNRAADWNNFQTQLKNLGIDRYLQIIQKTYDGSAFAQK
jgi:putative aldouronate transport system substrate-binding protein